MEKIEQGYYYHIYNRGAGRARLFWDNNDFTEFLEKYYYYLFPSIETFAWCLLNNHFHALIRIRTNKEQVQLFQNMKKDFDLHSFHGKMNPSVRPFIASKQLSHFMNGYTRYVNKKMERTGTLIEGPLKRIKILNENNFLHLACYIHRNPIHHGITDNYVDYSYSSYMNFICAKNSFTNKERVLKAFGGKENFIRAHEEFKLKLDKGDDFYLE